MAKISNSTEPEENNFGFDMAPIGLVVTRERIVERCNRRFCEIFGYAAEELEGQLLSMLYPSNKEFLDIGKLGRAQMLTNGRYQDERIMKRANGELFWCRARGQSEDPKHPFTHCVWSFVDLSDSRPMVKLTRRERQVAMLLTQGLPTKAIAQDLALSPRTVEVYRAKLLQKFEAKNGFELMAKLSGMPV
ncbi:LuxR C-terminal-related transcriptional regulator [Pseudohalocynthiibacter aestuariivivens]|uniref:LuxR C-terminal-related transcriptional regulator n=1 Tax=Pseudohalocynthiibacter aestuariivivens TaxID=1591409 RepID=A0ABV5JCH4_9RHOB|nr:MULTISPECIES: PAS and helix-turn-helix domain-containing protein [Pseudohalocynthiibacter]MCK0102435.1 PAS and helix-turn-helix domain-containing protein [Pseudohalocynthiibacter sp. F2068]